MNAWLEGLVFFNRMNSSELIRLLVSRCGPEDEIELWLVYLCLYIIKSLAVDCINFSWFTLHWNAIFKHFRKMLWQLLSMTSLCVCLLLCMCVHERKQGRAMLKERNRMSLHNIILIFFCFSSVMINLLYDILLWNLVFTHFVYFI